VSISGDTAIVGASVNDDDGYASGSAYIFQRDEGGAGACCYIEDETGSEQCQVKDEIYCTDVLQGVYQGDSTMCPTARVTTASHTSGPFTHLTNPEEECPEGIARADCGEGDPIDPWRTTPDAVMCHRFGLNETQCLPGPPDCSPPIPADFFDPGSDPFDGQVCLEGEPLGPTPFGEFGDADTLVRRSADPFDRCELPSGTESDVIPTEVVALNLKSTDPITVTYNGGQNPDQWDVKVDLSTVVPEPGWITAVKSHCNGGTYTSELHVQPRFTFTKVGDPGEVRVLDTGVNGIPYVTLLQEDDPPWTSVLWGAGGSSSPDCTDFHPGVEEPTTTTECDCNVNYMNDVCEADCQPNGVPDECDIAAGTSLDNDGNGVPDECPFALGPPEVPADPEHQVLKNRYISVNPKTIPTTDTVIKVEVAQMRRCQNAPTRGCMTNSDCDPVCDDVAGAPPYHTLKCPPTDCSTTVPPSVCIASGPCVDLAPTFDPPLAWVVQQPIQDPTGGCKRPGCPPYDPGEDNCCEDDDWMAYLSATVPELTGGYTSWAQVWADLPAEVLHIAGCPIVPATSYAVYACDPDNLDQCSAPLMISTAKFPVNARPTAFPLYGDVCGGTQLPGPTVLPPDGYVSVKDLLVQNLTIINYGGLTLPQMHPTWADLHGSGTGIPPNYNLGVADLMAVYVFGLVNSHPYVNSQGGLDPQDCP
jgi:hypothetical protein